MAENLWALREQKRLSVATLASRAGLAIGLVIEYESGTRSIDPRYLSRLSRALYVEETDIKMRSDPRPGGGQPERPAQRAGELPAPPGPRQAASSEPRPFGQEDGRLQGRPQERPMGRVRPGPVFQSREPRPPAPARQSQLAHLNDLLQRLGKARAELEAELGKPLDQLDRLEAGAQLGRIQSELRGTPTPDRHRAYLPEAVDQYELLYLTAARDEHAELHFTLFDGRQVHGQVAGFGPYSITVRDAGGSDLTLNKLAIVSYARKPGSQAAAAEERDR